MKIKYLFFCIITSLSHLHVAYSQSIVIEENNVKEYRQNYQSRSMGVVSILTAKLSPKKKKYISTKCKRLDWNLMSDSFLKQFPKDFSHFHVFLPRQIKGQINGEKGQVAKLSFCSVNSDTSLTCYVQLLINFKEEYYNTQNETSNTRIVGIKVITDQTFPTFKLTDDEYRTYLAAVDYLNKVSKPKE